MIHFLPGEREKERQVQAGISTLPQPLLAAASRRGDLKGRGVWDRFCRPRGPALACGVLTLPAPTAVTLKPIPYPVSPLGRGAERGKDSQEMPPSLNPSSP